MQALRQELETALEEFEERLSDAGDDAATVNQVETRYLTFATVAAEYADTLTTGTDPDEIPADLHAILEELFGARPAEHVIVVRAVEKPTFETYPKYRPEQVRPEGDLIKQILARSEHPEPRLVSVFEIPRSFRDAMLTQLVVVGHELTHAQHALADFSYRETITAGMEVPDDLEPNDLIEGVFPNWLEEIFADITSVRRMGPAAILVWAEYARLVGAYGADIPAVIWEYHFDSHPPAEVRLHFMFRALERLNLRREDLGELVPALAEWRRIAERGASAPEDAPAKLKMADGLVRGAFERIYAQAVSLVPPDVAYTSDSLARSRALAEQFADGIAPSDRLGVGDSLGEGLRSQPLELPDLYNAAALVRWVPRLLDRLIQTMGLADDDTLAPEDKRARALGQLDELLARAIEGLRVRKRWPARLWQAAAKT